MVAVIVGLSVRYTEQRTMSIRKEITHCSDLANRIVMWWCILEGLIRLGIWLAGWSWLRWAENATAAMAAFLFVRVWIDFRIMQITEAAMGEMQEYIDKRLEEKESEDDSL